MREGELQWPHYSLTNGQNGYSGRLVLWLPTLRDVDGDKPAYSAAKKLHRLHSNVCFALVATSANRSGMHALLEKERKFKNKTSLLIGDYRKVAVIHNALHALLSLNCF